jgi:hypothetical protein
MKSGAALGKGNLLLVYLAYNQSTRIGVREYSESD